MREDLSDLAEEYELDLRNYIAHPSEEGLEHAYELGHKTVSLGLGVLQLSELHTSAMAKMLSDTETKAETAETANLSLVFFNEALSSFEITHRGFREANAKLLRLTQELEQRVEERTAALKEELSRVELLQETAAASASSLSIQEICKRVLNVAYERMDIHLGSIYYIDEEAQILRQLALFGYPEKVLSSVSDIPIDERSWIGELVTKDLAILTHERAMPPRGARDRTWRAITEKDRWMLLPVKSKGRSLGALVFAFSGRRTFAEEEISLFQSIARQLGTAMENARIYESEHAIAVTLQKALLTMPDKVSGLEFAHLYHSASEAAQVGGDFYDLFELESGRVGVVVGDVAGKGLEAATLTALVRNTIKAYAYEAESPAIVISEVNEAIWRTTRGSSFVTIFFGILDCANGAFVYCNGGHLPPICKRKSGAIDFLEEPSPIVGAFQEFDYEEGRTNLGIGDVLILYTDGILDARRNGTFYGEDRLIEAVKSRQPVKNLPRHIFRNVMEFSGGKISDDIALLSIARHPLES